MHFIQLFIFLGVGHILGYDHETEAHLIQQEMRRLFADCEAAQEEIVNEIETRKQQFNIKVKIKGFNKNRHYNER